VPQALRVVLDTNILLRGLLNIRSSAGEVVEACDRRLVVLLLSRPVLTEYRVVLTDHKITERYPELTAEKVDVALRRLCYFGDILHPIRARFHFPRDPNDEKFLELAIAGRATHIVTADKDLLWLSAGHADAARRLRQRAPNLRVLDAQGFLHELERGSHD
jgi:uncharacterized protein